MAFTKIRNLSLTEMFVQQVENMILSGELSVGEKLPSARELSAQMGVSRPVISAGLIELEKLGFLEVHPRRGAFVSDYRRKGTVETLMAIMRYNGGAMRRHEVESLLQVRGALEELCVEQVIQHTTDQELARLASFLDGVQCADDPGSTAEAVFAFHHELAVLSGNILLPLLYHSFRSESLYLWTIGCRLTGNRGLYETKLRLYQALLNRDLQEARSVTRHSIEAAMQALTEYVSR